MAHSNFWWELAHSQKFLPNHWFGFWMTDRTLVPFVLIRYNVGPKSTPLQYNCSYSCIQTFRTRLWIVSERTPLHWIFLHWQRMDHGWCLERDGQNMRDVYCVNSAPFLQFLLKIQPHLCATLARLSTIVSGAYPGFFQMRGPRWQVQS